MDCLVPIEVVGRSSDLYTCWYAVMRTHADVMWFGLVWFGSVLG